MLPITSNKISIWIFTHKQTCLVVVCSFRPQSDAYMERENDVYNAHNWGQEEAFEKDCRIPRTAKSSGGPRMIKNWIIKYLT